MAPFGDLGDWGRVNLAARNMAGVVMSKAELARTAHTARLTYGFMM